MKKLMAVLILVLSVQAVAQNTIALRAGGVVDPAKGSVARYVSRVFDDYKAVAGVNGFQGKVAELGAGDSCGVALLFLSSGCEQIDLVDRFFSPRDNARQQESRLIDRAYLRTQSYPA